jgi:hypothetical protein
MKRFLLFFVLLLFTVSCFNTAGAIENPTGVTFIYINGSNNLSYKNRDKFRVDFIANVKKLHPQIKKRFEADELIQEHFLRNGEYVINPDPITFYWGDRSLKVVETIDKDLASAAKYSPRIAHQARSIFAHCLHDAVWVQKQKNMMSVLDDLHKVVKAEQEKGNKVVLLGYSAGSFVTYQYYMTKGDNIIPSEFSFHKYSSEVQDFVAKTPVRPTCFDALVDADLIKYNLETGKYDINKNLDVFKKNYANLDSYTDKACFTGGTVKGVVGFASPARLFYSDFVDATTSISNMSKLMAKSIVENDVFYLTVNYSNDPFGFSNSENFTLKYLQENQYIPATKKITKGFIYNKSNNYVPRTFVTAHLAYWDTPKRFSKAIVKAFNEGFPNFYGLEK